jgi:hypothetical protein
MQHPKTKKATLVLTDIYYESEGVLVTLCNNEYDI